jgi:hypothetical protein
MCLQRINLQRLCWYILFILTALEAVMSGQETDRALKRKSSQEHVAWVAKTLKEMGTIKPGMTRNDLLAVFKPEGGLFTDLDRTFVSRDCPYFKVDVEFRAIGRPDRDREGRVTLMEDKRDIIIKISRPYLQFSITD